MTVNRLILILVVFTGCLEKNTHGVNDTGNKTTQKIKMADMTITAKYTTGTDYRYFNVKFNRNKPVEMPKEKIIYAAFDMQQDFFMVSAGDSLSPAICQKIENGLQGSYEYMIAFDPNRMRKDFTLVYRDKIFGIGTVAFSYNKMIPGIKSSNAE